MKDKKSKKEIKTKKEKIEESKSSTSNKFIEIIKKKWLVDTSKTFLLIVIIVAAFIGSNILIQNLELTPIDFSQDKLYTLTKESKEKVKDINKDVNIYFVGYTDDDSNLDLAKQYKNVNEKIVTQAVDANNRPDLVQKYGIESGTKGIIVECGEKSKVLTEDDLVTYDTSTYETISIAEEKLTSSIISVTSESTPKVYFLEGYSEISLSNNMNFLNMYLENEINEVNKLDVLSVGKIPDDCDTLVITTPSKDFDDVATKSITEYIKSGRNILWLNSALTKTKELPNVNKILAMYGVNPFEVGVIRETNSSKMITNSPDLIIPELQNTTVTKDLYNSTGVIFINATKVNINEDRLSELKVKKTDLALASESSYFRTNFNIKSNVAENEEETGTFIVGAELDKTLKEANDETGESSVTSKLIIFGENYFITDYPLSENSQNGAVQLAYNKDIVLNSIAYLVDREEDITARKSTGTVTYTATDAQDTIIRIVIFTVPIVVIITGIVVWQIRRRKK